MEGLSVHPFRPLVEAFVVVGPNPAEPLRVEEVNGRPLIKYYAVLCCRMLLLFSFFLAFYWCSVSVCYHVPPLL